MLFKYLRRVLKAGDENCQEGAENLNKARKIWVQMKRILIREGADPNMLGLFF